MKTVVVASQKITVTAEFDDKELEVLMLALKLFTMQFSLQDENKRALALGMYHTLGSVQLTIEEFCKPK